MKSRKYVHGIFLMNLLMLALAEGNSGIHNCNLKGQLCLWGSVRIWVWLCWPNIQKFLVCIWLPLWGSSHLGSYWMHLDPRVFSKPWCSCQILCSGKTSADFLEFYPSLLHGSGPLSFTVSLSACAWQKPWKHLEPALVQCGKQQRAPLAAFSVGWSQTASELTFYFTEQR